MYLLEQKIYTPGHESYFSSFSREVRKAGLTEKMITDLVVIDSAAKGDANSKLSLL